jgi:DNA-binding Lrp family transcriptional regulator
MTAGLSAFEKRLCNILQEGLPLNRRPFARIAEKLGCDEQTILKCTQGLVSRGFIRRIGAVINWRATGQAGTLVTAHIEQKDLQKVVDAVNRIKSISHNYLREHHYNLWFTLRADSQKQIAAILKKLSKQFGTAFHSLPIKRVFKLDVRFDAISNGRSLLHQKKNRIKNRTVNLESIDERILSKLNEGLEVTAQPYDFLCNDKLSIDEVLSRIKKMIVQDAIHRLGAVVNHHKLGFVANAMFVCKADENKIAKVGKNLARLKIVSHCYQRRPFKGWQYNVFAMMHGRSLAQIQGETNKFVKSQKIEAWDVLPTVEVLKKK